VRPKSSPTVEYPYTDENDQVLTIEFAVKKNDTPNPRYEFSTPQGEFKVLTKSQELHEAAWVEPTTPAVTDIVKWDDEAINFVKAEDDDVKLLGKYLEQLDVDAISKVYAGNLQRRRQAKAPKIGGKLLDRFRQLVDR
jgi:hypothetical protein